MVRDGPSNSSLESLKDGQSYLVGIISRESSHCSQAGEPTIHVNVYHYLDWINSVARNYFEEHKPDECDEYFPWKEGFFVNGAFVN